MRGMRRPRLAEQARRHAAWAGEPPLALFATRLEGRAAGGPGTIPNEPSELLSSAIEGFAELEAVWEAAVTRLDLAQVLATSGEAEERVAQPTEARPVFERLGSVRELARVDEVLGRPT